MGLSAGAVARLPRVRLPRVPARLPAARASLRRRTAEPERRNPIVTSADRPQSPTAGAGTGGRGTGDRDVGGEPLFGPGSQFHTLFNDPRWALAMIRATVLEAAHPQIGAALIENSTFVVHPWRRLSNTFTSLRRMFGADDHVRQREATRLNRMHARLHGTDARDRPY